jgi:hypothetical protein
MNEVTLNTFKELLSKIGASAETEPAFMYLYENRLKANAINSAEFVVAEDLETDNEAQAFISKIRELFESTSVPTKTGAEITFHELTLLSSGLRYIEYDRGLWEDEWGWMTGTEDSPSIFSGRKEFIDIAEIFYKGQQKFYDAVSELLLYGSKPDEGMYWLYYITGGSGEHSEPCLMSGIYRLMKYPPEVFGKDDKYYRIGRFTKPGEDEFGNLLEITWARTKWDFIYNVDRGISFPIYISAKALEHLRQLFQKLGMSVNFNVMKIVEALENNEPVSIHLLWGYAGIRAYVNNVPMLEFHVYIINDKLIATDFSEYEPSKVNRILEQQKKLAEPADSNQFYIDGI